MTGNTRVPPAEITGPYGAVLKRFSKRMLGEVPESLGVMWHSKPVLKASLGLGRKAGRVLGRGRAPSRRLQAGGRAVLFRSAFCAGGLGPPGSVGPPWERIR